MNLYRDWHQLDLEQGRDALEEQIEMLTVRIRRGKTTGQDRLLVPRWRREIAVLEQRLAQIEVQMKLAGRGARA